MGYDVNETEEEEEKKPGRTNEKRNQSVISIYIYRNCVASHESHNHMLITVCNPSSFFFLLVLCFL